MEDGKIVQETCLKHYLFKLYDGSGAEMRHFLFNMALCKKLQSNVVSAVMKLFSCKSE